MKTPNHPTPQASGRTARELLIDFGLGRAVRVKSGNLEPYMQQLSIYDARDIKEFRMALELSEDIAVHALQSGMMSGKSITDIKKQIKMFLSPTVTKTHGRPIYAPEAKTCGLNIEDVDLTSDLWKLSRQLYSRLNMLVNRDVAKCIESSEHSFHVGVSKD